MTCSMIRNWRLVATAMLAALLAQSVGPALAASPVKLRGSGALDFDPDGTSAFVLDGTASHLGRYTCYGEVEFLPGEDKGSLDGAGVAVFEAANGDLLVGVVTWQHDADDVAQVRFSWRDSVELNDGTSVASTGRFEEERPPGIIAILIGFRAFSVQTAR